jgi:hypothetical protein
VQDLVGQVVGRPNKKPISCIQIWGESILESELFKKETKKKKNFSEKCELIMANFSGALDSMTDFNPSPVADLDS